MRIKEIKLNNIRSFKDMTNLETSPNVNLIIGKNGSGKSNVLSAVKYLLSHGSRSSLEERESFIYEGSHNSELTGTIEIKFENDKLKFPAGKEFVIRKEISLKKEEYFLDDKFATKEELNAMFESAGLPIDSKYFIVPQGEIDRLSVMSDDKRYELIKEISGALTYEEDRKKFVEQLKDTEEMKKKIFIFNEKINIKLEKLRKDQRKLILVEKIDEEKNIIDRIILERELDKIYSEIKTLQSKFIEVEDNKQNSLLEKRIQLKQLKEEKIKLLEELKRENCYEMSENVLNLEIEELKIKQREENENKKKFEHLINEEREMKEYETKEEEKIQKYTKELEEIKLNILAKEMENSFLKNNLNISFFTQEEKNEVQKEIKEIQNKLGNENESTEVFCEKKYVSLLNERKRAWVDENNLENKLKRFENEMRKIEQSILLNYGISEEIIKNIKEHSGVYGCIFELINIPEELYAPVSSVISKNFFNIVVENEDIATDLFGVIKNRVTFVALNRVKVEEEKMIDDENMIPLWKQLEADDKFKDLLKYITRNTYLVSDIKCALQQKKKYNVNIVTLEGEFISKNGIITGGYEEKRNIFIEFKYLQNEIHKLKKEKNELTNKIALLNESINLMQHKKNELRSKEDIFVIKAKLIFLLRKAQLMNKGFTEKELRNNTFDLENIKIKKNRLEMETENTKLRLLELKNKLKQIEIKILTYKSKINSFDLKIKLEEVENKIKKIKEEEKCLIYEINDESTENNKNKKISNLKSVLIEKRNKILDKISTLSVQKEYKKSKYFAMNESEMAEEMKRLLLKKNEYKAVNYKATTQLKEMEMHQNNLTTRMNELDLSKSEIESFLEELDKKKESVIESTFKAIVEGFNYFIDKLSPKFKIDLVKENDSVLIYNSGIKVNPSLFSGGQRTVIALSLIFAIQRIDPAPFYLFDEIDANLDYESRLRLCDLIKNIINNNSIQFIFTTFNKELLECGNEFFMVNFKDKRSFIKSCTKEEANLLIRE